MQGSAAAAAATVGSPVGKISAALWSRVEPAITINERKRPVRANKREREKKKTQSQTKNNVRNEGKERGKEGERETTHEEVRGRQREGLKSIPIRKGGDSGGRS